MINKIKMVVVGLVFGRYIVEEQLLKGPGKKYIELAGVCDLNMKLCSEIALTHNLKQYKDIDEILKDPSIEAIGLFSPPGGHSELIRKIIHAGKHVMTTKPFDLNAEAAYDVLKEAKRLEKVVHLNSPGPLPAPETTQIIKWTHEYDLGKPVSVLWETYADYHHEADGSWYDDPTKCPVAPIFRLGIYGLNQIVRLCGNVKQAGVVSSRFRTGRPTPDNAILSLVFANGAVGAVHASFCVRNGHLYPDNLTLNYERGTIRTRPLDTNENGDTSSRRVKLQTLNSKGEISISEVVFKKNDLTGKYQWDNFYKAIRSNFALPGEITPEQIISGIQIINAMSQAEKTGKAVEIKKT